MSHQSNGRAEKNFRASLFTETWQKRSLSCQYTKIILSGVASASWFKVAGARGSAKLKKSSIKKTHKNGKNVTSDRGGGLCSGQLELAMDPVDWLRTSADEFD